MKKVLLQGFVIFSVIMISSLSFAGEKKVASNATVKSFQAFDPSYEQAHVCSTLSTDCGVPVKALNSAVETPKLHIDFYAPTSQNYTKVYIVSDTAGTVVSLQSFSTFLLAGFTAFNVVTPLPPGDYTFTGFAMGDDGTAAISDPYKFSVF